MDDNAGPAFFVGLVIGILIAVAVGFCTRHVMRNGAIANGVAEYVFIDEHGNTEFRWNTASGEATE